MLDTENRLPVSPERRKRCVVSRGKRYCVLCSNHQKTILQDGSRLTMHKIPGGKSKSEMTRRKIWIRALKLHRPDLPISDNTRVCCLHFENHKYVQGESVPKYFNLEKLGKAEGNRHKRRPLCRSTLENMHHPKLCEEDVSLNDEMLLATRIVEDAPKAFLDSIENCENVVEIQHETEALYQVEEKVRGNDHAYSLPAKDAKTCEITTQTSPGSLKPEDIENNDEKTRFYTGYPSYLTFMLFFETFLKHGADRLNYWEGQKRTLEGKHVDNNQSKPGRKRKLRPIDEFFMVCLRLRLGLLQEQLGDMFCVSTMTVSRIMNTWINFMYDHMKGLIPWPSKQQILANLPKCFQDMADSRIVIDATEFFCEKPSSLAAQHLTWSEYKHHNTFKVLVGVAPNGLVTFISSVWGGNASDRHITQKDGDLFIPKLEPGDVVLADKGFTVADLLPSDIGLNMPPFVSKARQMTKTQFFKTQQIASSRIVVEMKMEQIKNFRLLQTVLPLSEAHLAEQMIVICTAMTNLYEPLLK